MFPIPVRSASTRIVRLPFHRSSASRLLSPGLSSSLCGPELPIAPDVHRDEHLLRAPPRGWGAAGDAGRRGARAIPDRAGMLQILDQIIGFAARDVEMRPKGVYHAPVALLTAGFDP